MSPPATPTSREEPLQVVRFDLRELAGESLEQWAVHPLTRVNDTAVSLAVIQGTYFPHYHSRDDELIIVLDGRLLVHLDGETVELTRGQAMIVPPGVTHTSEAPERTVVLNVKGTTGDTVRTDQADTTGDSTRL